MISLELCTFSMSIRLERHFFFGTFKPDYQQRTYTVFPANKQHARIRPIAHYEAEILFDSTLFSNGIEENTKNEQEPRHGGKS